MIMPQSWRITSMFVFSPVVMRRRPRKTLWDVVIEPVPEDIDEEDELELLRLLYEGLRRATHMPSERPVRLAHSAGMPMRSPCDEGVLLTLRAEVGRREGIEDMLPLRCKRS